MVFSIENRTGNMMVKDHLKTGYEHVQKSNSYGIQMSGFGIVTVCTETVC
jgi:hypothetical protein